jgi:hypothetical protein
MTPNRFYSVDDLTARLPVNHRLSINSGYVAIRDGAGFLLRGFMLHYMPGKAERINADDFDNWLKFMGFDDGKRS